MNVLLFTSEEPLYLPRYLQPVLSAHAESIGAIVIAPPPSSVGEQARRYLDMFGPVDFLRMGARFAAGGLLGAIPPGIDRRLTGHYHSVASVAAAHGVPVERVEDVSALSFVAGVRERDPDVVLSIVCGQKLPPELLAVPDVAINLHGSLLPKYRGRATAFWPLYYGDDESGVTAHLMSETFDAGPIVERRSFPIRDDDAMHDVYLQTAAVGADLAVDLLDRLDVLPSLPGDLETRPNPTTADDYHTLPTPQERRTFKRRGNEFV